jgi:hypothetical protein
MQPGIIAQDFGGAHNSDLTGTRARLLKGGSYRPQRIISIVPAIGSIPPKVYLSHVNIGYPPNNGVVRLLALGMEVGDAYSNAIRDVLAHPQLSDWEYVLTIESDNCPPADGVIRLVQTLEEHQELSAVGGLYFTKGFGGCAQIWGDPKDGTLNFRPQLPDPAGGLIECCGVAQGFTLYRLKMFKDERLRKPWFVTQVKDGLSTQDLYFWGDARKYGYRCAIDCSVRVGHYDYEGKFGPPDTMW